jgi:hypothetical protein
VVAQLERAWSSAVGQALAGGTGSFVATAQTAEDGVAIRKIAIPEVGFAEELHALESAQGHGYVRLLAADRKGAAMLLEALGPTMALLAPPLRPAGPVVTPDDEKAKSLFIWSAAYGRNWDARVQSGSSTRLCGTPNDARPRSTWSAASWSSAIPIHGMRCKRLRHGRGRRRDSSSWTRSGSSPTPLTT